MLQIAQPVIKDKPAFTPMELYNTLFELLDKDAH